MLGGGGMAEPPSAVLGGGGTIEQDGSAISGGGGIAEQDGSAVTGGGGTAEQDGSAVTGGGGITEQDGSVVLGGGGMTDPESEVRGGGGIAEQASAVLGGGGIIDPERAWLSALARTCCPASTIARPSSSPVSDRVPDSMYSILQRIRPSVNPVLARNPCFGRDLRQAPGARRPGAATVGAVPVVSGYRYSAKGKDRWARGGTRKFCRWVVCRNWLKPAFVRTLRLRLVPVG